MKILVTGTAGFIGFHMVNRLLAEGNEVVGLDNINDYYDPRVKYGRLKQTGIEERELPYNQAVRSRTYSGYRFVRLNLEDRENVLKLFRDEKFDRVCHFAAQAGVRYSIENPHAYIDSNISGFINILEGCRQNGVGHLVYASSSSVYGLNEQMPFSTASNVDHPVSLYAATKKSNELMAHSYSHLYGIPTTGLRFFTVYGPWGRPDMAYFLFVKAALEGRAIDVFNNGEMQRDFTYIDDIVEGVTRVLARPPHGNAQWDGKHPDPSSSSAPYRIYNIGNNAPIKLMDFINAIENALGTTMKKNMMPMQPGDVPATYADVSGLVSDMHYKPDMPLQEGVDRFVAWYREFFDV